MVEVSPAFRRKIRVLPQVLSRRVRPVMEKTADELVQMMRTLVPVEQGDLRDSIGWSWGDAPKGATVLDRIKAKGERSNRIVIYAGGKAAPYAKFVEFGTSPHAVTPGGDPHPGARASPFFWPAYRTLRRRIKQRMTRAIRAAIKESSGLA